jgi:hypothetical protein
MSGKIYEPLDGAKLTGKCITDECIAGYTQVIDSNTFSH